MQFCASSGKKLENWLDSWSWTQFFKDWLRNAEFGEGWCEKRSLSQQQT